MRTGDWPRIALITALTAATAMSGGFVTSLSVAGATGAAAPSDTTSPTPTPSLTESPTPSPSPTATASATASASPTASPTETPTPTPSTTSSAPTSATIIIGSRAQNVGYQTPQVTLAQGGSLTVLNMDSMEHTVTSVELGSNQQKLFDVYAEPSPTPIGIPIASKLAAGTYHFYCRFHPQVMRGTLTIVGGGGGGVHPVAPKFEQPLVTPKVLTGSHLTIPIERAAVRVLPHGDLTTMWTYGGGYPGPTIIRPAGQDTKVTFVDKLPRSDGSFTVHYHGDHHASADDGRPTTQLIGAGQRRTYDYPGTDGGRPEPAAFNFYHDHRMGLTARNNWMGLQGMFITQDAASKNLRLPSGKFDLPLLVSERTFTSANQLEVPFSSHPTMMTKGPKAPPGDGTVGAQILVDGRFAPYANVSTHRYRLRLLNAAPFTSYNFQLSDGHPFIQVGTGDGLLAKPIVRQSILLGPAQRADVIVDFHNELHKNVLLESVPRTDNPPSGSVGAPNAAIMQFRVTRHASTDGTRIPSRLGKIQAINAPAKVSALWRFGLSGDPSTGSVWTVDGRPFDPNRADLKVPLGSTQTWILRNDSPITHYIHLHEELWHTLARDGKKPPLWEQGYEDTWRLDPGEYVKVAARFTDYTGEFMLHCHMLDHEDHGLMAQFDVVRTKGTAATGLAARAARLDRQWSRRAAAHMSRIWGVRVTTALFGMPVFGTPLFGMPVFGTPAPTAFGLSPAELKRLMCGPRPAHQA